jgi:ketosteroid isomerase-like protein
MLEDAYREAIDAFNRRDLPGWLALIDDDFDLESRFSRVGDTFYRGREAVENWWADLQDAWEHLDVEVQEVRRVAPDQTLALVVLDGRGRGSGLEVREAHAHLVDWRDGKWLRLRYVDREEAERELKALD